MMRDVAVTVYVYNMYTKKEGILEFDMEVCYYDDDSAYNDVREVAWDILRDDWDYDYLEDLEIDIKINRI